MPRLILAAEQGDVEFFRTSRLAAPRLTRNPPRSPCRPLSRLRKDPTPDLQVDQPLFEAPFQTLLSLAQAAAAQADAGIDSQWLSVVLGDLAARLQAGENQADLMEALLRLTVVPNIGTTAQNLTDYANANLSPDRGQGCQRGGRADDAQRRPRHDVEHPGRRDDAGHEA